MSEDDLAEGRVHRGRVVVAGALAIAVLGALPIVFGLLTPDRPPARTSARSSPEAPFPTPTPIETGLSGRLVYVGVDPNDSGVPRLVALDLASATYEVGPAIRDVDAFAQLVPVGPARRWLVLIRSLPGTGTYVADLVRELADQPEEVARGNQISVTPDGKELLVTDVDVDESRRCRSHVHRLPFGIELLHVALPSGASEPVYREAVHCGGADSAIAYGTNALLLDVPRGRSYDVYLLQGGTKELALRNAVATSIAGIYVFARHRHDLLVWPGGGAARPIVTGERLIGGVVAASSSGRYVVVDGTTGEEAGLWIVDVAAGTVVLGPDSLPSRFRIFAEAVADDGTAFLVGYDGIVAVHGQSVGSVALPSGAPEPVVGPAAWLP